MTTVSEYMEYTSVTVDSDPFEVPHYPVYVESDESVFDILHVWSLASEGSDKKVRLQAFSLGQPIPPGAVYFRSLPSLGGTYVWHLFDVTDVKNDNDS